MHSAERKFEREHESLRKSAAYVFPNGLVGLQGRCLAQAKLNSLSPAYKNLKLKIVVGSLGIGVGKPFYEYGDPSWTTVDHFQCNYNKNMLDAHAWLEDEEGRVYDVQTQYWQNVASIQRRIIRAHARLPEGTQYRLIEAKTKEELRHLGFHYSPCPKELQAALLHTFWDKMDLIAAADPRDLNNPLKMAFQQLTELLNALPK